MTYSLANADVAELFAVAKRFLIGSLSATEEPPAGLRGTPERARSGR